MPRFAVTIVSPPGYAHAGVFAEIAQTLHHALLGLGHDSIITTEGALPGRRHIVLGSNLLPEHRLPLAPDAILYNLEQVEVGSPWFRPELLQLFRRYTVWDYNPRNAAALRAQGIRVSRIMPVGYVPELTRIRRSPTPQMDVLFIGSVNERRKRVIDSLRAAGLTVGAAFGVYGEQRDQLIAQATLQLNVHFYEARVLELVRVSYLLANRCVVLSEPSSDPAEDAALAEGIAFARYDDLVARAQALVAAPEERARLARRGFELMRGRPAVEYLRAALAGEP